MKKSILVSVLFFLVAIVNAQPKQQDIELIKFEKNSYNNMQMFEVSTTIFAAGLFMTFILLVLKRVYDYRLKTKIVEKGVPENIIASILQPSRNEDGNSNIKWFSILAGIGAGLTIVNYTQPLGIHSLAIMSFCISVSFLGYYFFTKKMNPDIEK